MPFFILINIPTLICSNKYISVFDSLIVKKSDYKKILKIGNSVLSNIDENCECPITEEVYTDEENIGVDIKPGYFYYDKNAPKQILVPNGGDKSNVSLDPKKPIYDKINWVNHDTKSSDPDFDNKSYKINPNNYDLYKDGKLVDDSTYSINL